MSARSILVTLAATTVTLLGCGGSDSTGPAEPQPQPGQLQVTLSGGAVGGLVLTVTGEGITAPAGPSGAMLYHDLSGSTLNAVVVGTSLSGQVLVFSVPDVRDASEYAVTLEQVAGTSNQTLAPTGYSATLSVAP